MSKTQEIMELIKEGKNNTEIMAEVDCSKQLISNVRRKVKEDDDPGNDPLRKGEEEDYNDSFIRKVAIEPDTEVLTDDKDKKTEKKTSYDVECPSCGHEWAVESDEHIESCPECGQVFA